MTRARTSLLKQQVNEELASIGAEIRVMTYDVSTAVLNNGLILDRAGWISLRDRIKGCRESRVHIDDLFSTDEMVRKKTALMIRRAGGKRGAVTTLDRHRDALIERASKNLERARAAGKCGFEKGIVPWNSGLSKDTNATLARLAKERIGTGNPCFGKQYSDSDRQYRSRLMSDKIAAGEFTPNVLNSFTSKTYLYNGIKYRSSWEVIFAHFHPECSYETLRLRYVDEKPRTYLVDFVDHASKIAYEVKPSCKRETSRNKAKELALQDWCEANGYACIVVGEDIIGSMLQRLGYNHPILDGFTSRIIRGLKRLYENDQTNGNSETCSHF